MSEWLFARLGSRVIKPGPAVARIYVLSWLATKLKVRLNLVPTEVKAAIAAIEIKDAMRPYSIAVDPLSSVMKRETRLIFLPRCAFSEVNTSVIAPGGLLRVLELARHILIVSELRLASCNCFWAVSSRNGF